MLSKNLSMGLNGLEGFAVDVEIDIAKGIATFDIVGLADTAIKESKERVRSAIGNSGLIFPTSKLTVNLAPADKKKEGAYYDLPIAIGILYASGQLPEKKDNYVLIGELSLDGSIRGVRGILPLIISARELGFDKFIIPFENANEASFVGNIDIYPAKSLTEVVAFLNGEITISPIEAQSYDSVLKSREFSKDFKFVKGQKIAKRALEIASAGGHNILLIGPPGMGKTMLARCVPSILPELSFEEALEITKIHSVSGLLNSDVGIVTERPFRAPHHTASVPALCGGGINSKAGEVTLANNGVLFLDELPEFPRQVLESLRQPLEDRHISVSRANSRIDYPANFMLVTSMNPCPCGNYGSTNKECRCTRSQIQKYISKLSGPLLDRIDLQVEVDSIEYSEIKSTDLSEPSSEIKKRVEDAREIQRKRYASTHFRSNAEVAERELLEFCALDDKSEALLKTAFESLNMSVRARSRIIKVARTIADLAGQEDINASHIAEAIQYRTLDRKYWDR